MKKKQKMKIKCLTDVEKRQLIIQYAKDRGIKLFVETGTYYGETVEAVRDYFDEIWSVEISNNLYSLAAQKFNHHPHIHIIEGDSSIILPDILKKINDPCLFWLDGHFSGGDTSRGKEDSPVKEELKYILDHDQLNHVLLLDDVSDFSGHNGYPTIEEVNSLVQSSRTGWNMHVVDNIIRIHA